MRIFLSSVKAGLEDERRALPGLIQAIGHDVVMFEKFGARTEPSRQECVEAVQNSEVYLLLLGPNYGHVFPETGQSATHDEFVAAQTAGIPRLVFHKLGVDPEPEQAEFIRKVGDYSTGSFWVDYNDVTELQTLVAQAVLALAAAPSSLTFEPLTGAPTVEWKDDWDRQGRGRSNAATFAEVHVTPLDSGSRSARQMGDLSDPLITKLRSFGVLSQASGVDVDATADSVTITVPDQQRRGFHEVTARQFGGVRVAKTGQVSAWTTLPHGGVGAVVDPDDLIDLFAEQLRVIGHLNVLTGDKFAVSAGIGGSMTIVSIGKVGAQQRQASMGLGSDQPVRVIPDESVSAAAFDAGATDVARTLAQAILANFRH